VPFSTPGSYQHFFFFVLRDERRILFFLFFHIRLSELISNLNSYFEPPPRRCGLEDALGILSLSAKYEVVYLKRRALSHLATAYPSTLDEWRRRLDVSTFQPITEYCIPYARTNIPKSLSVLKILNQVGATWLLPAAFYECCRYDLKDLITDPAWMNGFDDGLKNTILTGYNKQVQEARRVLRFLHGPPDDDCPQPFVCLEVKRQHADESFSSWNMNDPFSIWDAGDWDLLEEMCGYCLDTSKRIHAEGCAELWNRLPSLYDLPAWEMLLELRDSTML